MLHANAGVVVAMLALHYIPCAQASEGAAEGAPDGQQLQQ